MQTHTHSHAREYSCSITTSYTSMVHIIPLSENRLTDIYRLIVFLFFRRWRLTVKKSAWISVVVVLSLIVSDSNTRRGPNSSMHCFSFIFFSFFPLCRLCTCAPSVQRAGLCVSSWRVRLDGPLRFHLGTDALTMAADSTRRTAANSLLLSTPPVTCARF